MIQLYVTELKYGVAQDFFGYGIGTVLHMLKGISAGDGCHRKGIPRDAIHLPHRKWNEPGSQKTESPLLFFNMSIAIGYGSGDDLHY